MSTTLLELADILKHTALKDCQLAQLPVPESANKALAIQVPYDTRLDCWQIMRSLLAETAMYPILTDCGYGNTENWQDAVLQENFFNRLEYQYPRNYRERRNKNIAPDFIIDVANQLDGRIILNRRRQNLPTIKSEMGFDSNGYVDDLEEIKEIFTISPRLKDKVLERALKSEEIVTLIDFEQWLFAWESKNVSTEKLLLPPNLEYLKWYDPNSQERTIILLLPTPNSWDTLAYMHFFGASNSLEEIAILKYWHEKYEAELVAHYGTMLHFYVKRKPKTLEDAFELAWQQDIFAPCTLVLPGVSVREHARALLHIDRWFLHERP